MPSPRAAMSRWQASIRAGSWVAMSGVAPPVEQDPQAAEVRDADLVAALPGQRHRLLVGALAEPDARARMGEGAAVVLGAAQRCLDHQAGRGMLRPQPAADLERRIGGGVVLHVEGHRDPRRRRGPADLEGILEGQLGIHALAERGELERHLGPRCQILGGEPLDQRAVDGNGRPRVRSVLGVLAEMVDGDREPISRQCPDHADRAAQALAGHEAADQPAGQRGAGDHLLHAALAGMPRGACGGAPPPCPAPGWAARRLLPHPERSDAMRRLSASVGGPWVGEDGQERPASRAGTPRRTMRSRQPSRYSA